MDKKIKKFNANPWGAKTGDCVIRALVLGIGIDYVQACKKLGVSYKKGHGLIRDSGISLDDVKSKFAEYFDIVQDYADDLEFVPDEFKDSKEDDDIRALELELGLDDSRYGITLSDFIDMYKDSGCYLVGLSTPDNKDGHIVFVNCNHGKNFAVDTFDSLKFIVDSFMRVKKTVPKDSPLHFKLDPVTKKFIV